MRQKYSKFVSMQVDWCFGRWGLNSFLRDGLPCEYQQKFWPNCKLWSKECVILSLKPFCIACVYFDLESHQVTNRSSSDCQNCYKVNARLVEDARLWTSNWTCSSSVGFLQINAILRFSQSDLSQRTNANHNPSFMSISLRVTCSTYVCTFFGHYSISRQEKLKTASTEQTNHS